MKLFLLILSLLISHIINATTYYISPTGNDATGNGTIANPWKTLYKATSTVTSAGNIIHVNAGTYTESAQCVLAIGVSIEGDGITSIIKSTSTADWTEILSLKSAEGTNGNQHISYLKFDGNNLTTFWAIVIQGRSNVSIHDCTVVNFREWGVIFGGRNDNSDGAPATFAAGNTFYNNTVSNCAEFSSALGDFGRGCLSLGGQDGMLIYGNTITQNQRATGHNGWPIKLIGNGGYNKGVKIYNNTLTKNIYQGTYPGDGDWPFVMESWQSLGGCEFYNNTCYEAGLDLAWNYKTTYANAWWVHDNSFLFSTANTHKQHGIFFEIDVQGAIVENNVFNHCGTGITINCETTNGGATTHQAINNLTIRKNLFSNLDGVGDPMGIQIYSDAAATFDIDSLIIDNNTFSASNGFIGTYFAYGASAGTTKNVFIRNNIYTGFSGLSWLYTSNSISTIDSFTIKNNDLFSNANSNNPIYNNGIPTHFTNTGNINGNPLFVGGGNYALQSLSTLINAGIYVGLPYNGTAPDAGYKEFGTAPLPIKLLEFNVKENNSKNLLQWITSTENNSDYFDIERSTNAQLFETMGRVNASGFSTIELKYSLTDANPLTGVNYYRLKMIDKDGTFEYSKIISITNKNTHTIGITYFDLSTGTNTASLIINSTRTQEANLTVIDVSGRTILNSQILLQNGTNRVNKNIPVITQGIYYVSIFTAEETVVKNIITRN